MASVASALLEMNMVMELIPDTSTADGALRKQIRNATGGRTFSNGTASGQADRWYYRSRAGLSAGATDNYNFLAAGSLTDPLGQAIDADEIKGYILKVTSGSVKLDAPASAFWPIFEDASDVYVVGEGQAVMHDFGPGGISVAAAASIDITESTGGATADYELAVLIAQ